MKREEKPGETLIRHMLQSGENKQPKSKPPQFPADAAAKRQQEQTIGTNSK